jgi:hypothetical protein
MKHNGYKGMTVIAIIALLCLSACDNMDNQDNDVYTIIGIYADGSPGISTTALTLTFDKDVPGLCADDIKINAISFTGYPSLLVSSADFPIIKGALTKIGATTYQLAIISGNSGRIKVGLDPYRGFIGWRAVDATVHARFHFRGTTELSIIGYSGNDTDVDDIPKQINGIPVTTIGVTMPNVTVLVAGFYDKQLTNVSIPDNITVIGNYAFARNQLSQVIIPDSVISIGSNAFASNLLTVVTISENVTAIGSNAFYTNQLTEIIIPEGVKTIGSSAFNVNKLTSVTIPENVTTIGSNAFANNELESVIIPQRVDDTTIGISAFANNQLSSVIIGEGVTLIRDYAFENNKLTSVSIPDSVSTIGSRAFSGNQLTSITIGKDVTLSSDSFDNGFENAYNDASKAAGTYIRPASAWEKGDDSD